MSIEEMLEADGLAIIGPIVESVEHRTRIAVEGRENRRDALFVILDTPGGIVEVVERVDPDALERSRQAAEQLAAVGIELGGYRITPKLDNIQSAYPSAYAQRLR